MALPPTRLTSFLYSIQGDPPSLAVALLRTGLMARRASVGEAEELIRRVLREAEQEPPRPGPTPIDRVATALLSSGLLSGKGQHWAIASVSETTRPAVTTAFALAGLSVASLGGAGLVLYVGFGLFIFTRQVTWLFAGLAFTMSVLALTAGLASRALWLDLPTAPRRIQFTGVSAVAVSLALSALSASLDSPTIWLTPIGGLVAFGLSLWYAKQLTRRSAG